MLSGQRIKSDAGKLLVACETDRYSVMNDQGCRNTEEAVRKMSAILESIYFVGAMLVMELKVLFSLS